jgi:hypothetical protein
MKYICKKQFELQMSADDWELYDMDGREEAAIAITKTLEQALNEGLPRHEVLGKVLPVMDKYMEFGATDSEGYRTLEYVLERAFE